LVTLNKKLEALVNGSNIPGNKDHLYNWVVDNKKRLLEILSEGGELTKVYWDDNEPVWRERKVTPIGKGKK